MKKQSILLVLLVGLIIPKINAQNYAFRVLAIKGQTKVKTADTKWNVLKTGVRLNEGDRIKLSDDNYVGLVHSSGKTLEIKEAGVYDISELSSKTGSQSQSIASKYADFVISKMSPEEIEKNRKKYASVTGSGERGLYDTDIHLFLPKSGQVLTRDVKVSWTNIESDNLYTILITNLFGEVLLTEDVTSNSYLIKYNALEAGLIRNAVLIDIQLKSDTLVKSQQVAIKWIEDDFGLDYKRELGLLRASLGNESSLNYLILAEFYEEKDLLLDAIMSYEKALQITPNIDYFKEVYNEFLIRNQLKVPEVKTQ